MDLQGNVVWSSGPQHRFGIGPYLIADGLIYVLDDDGKLTLAEAAARVPQLAQAQVLDGHDAWGPMALVARPADPPRHGAHGVRGRGAKSERLQVPCSNRLRQPRARHLVLAIVLVAIAVGVGRAADRLVGRAAADCRTRFSYDLEAFERPIRP